MNSKNIYRFGVYEFLDGEGKAPKHRAFNLFVIMLIFANVIAVILESHAAYRSDYSSYFKNFEIFSVVVFTFEYLGRIWSCVENENFQNTTPLKARIRYFFSPLAIIDLLAILPFYLSLFIAIDMRYLRMLRMLRLFKLSHYFKGLDIFITVITKEIVTIATVILTVLIMVILSASLMYTLEHRAQPEAFKDGLLIVKVAGSVWAQQLQYQKRDMIQKLNSALESELVRDIRFKTGTI